MKKIAVIGFMVAGLLAALLAVLIPFGSMRHERILHQPPLTLQELDRLVKTVPPSPGKSMGAQLGAPLKPADLPHRLNRTATDDQRREFFVAGRSRRGLFIAEIGGGPLGGVVEIVFAAAGRPDAGSMARASANLARGKWEEARKYFMDYLREDRNDPVWQQRACAHLAWLENDPEMAARYMDMACSGGDLFSIALSVEFATKIGSTELAEYYTRLGRSISTDFDEKFTTYGTEQPRLTLLYERMVLAE